MMNALVCVALATAGAIASGCKPAAPFDPVGSFREFVERFRPYLEDEFPWSRTVAETQFDWSAFSSKPTGRETIGTYRLLRLEVSDVAKSFRSVLTPYRGKLAVFVKETWRDAAPTDQGKAAAPTSNEAKLPDWTFEREERKVIWFDYRDGRWTPSDDLGCLHEKVIAAYRKLLSSST